MANAAQRGAYLAPGFTELDVSSLDIRAQESPPPPPGFGWPEGRALTDASLPGTGPHGRASSSMAARFRLQLLGRSFEVQSECWEASRLLDNLLPPMDQIVPSETPEHVFCLKRAPSALHCSYLLERDRVPLATAQTAEHLVSLLCFHLRKTATRACSAHVLIHAAALALDNRGCILVGPCGSGKSTLSMALVQEGFSFLSDDCTAIDRATNMLCPLPLPPKLDGEARALLGDCAIDWRDAVQHTPVPLRYIAFLERIEDRSSAMIPLAKVPSFWRLLMHPYMSHVRSARTLLQAVSQATTFRLRTGSPSEAARLLRARIVALSKTRGKED